MVGRIWIASVLVQKENPSALCLDPSVLFPLPFPTEVVGLLGSQMNDIQPILNRQIVAQEQPAPGDWDELSRREVFL